MANSATIATLGGMNTLPQPVHDPRTIGAAEDFTIAQDWEAYTAKQHGIWDFLYEQQCKLLPGRAASAFLKGLDALDLAKGGIPHFERMSDELEKLTLILIQTRLSFLDL